MNNLIAWLRAQAARLGRGHAFGGEVSRRRPDGIPVRVAPAELIQDPARAEQLGLTADARRLEEDARQRLASDWRRTW